MLLHGMKQEKHGEGPPPSTHHQPQSQHHSAPLYLEAQTRKRTREDDKPSFHDTHKDDGNKGGNWQLTALEHPVPPPQPRIAITHPWTQTRASLLPDPDVYIYNPTTTTTTTNKQEEGDTTRLPSIKHLRLDPTRPRHEWDPYGANPAHPTHAYSHYPTAPSYSPTQRSPLKVTQTITAPPPSPQPQVTELVQVKTNTFGFIETTFTNVPAKKVIRLFSLHYSLSLCTSSSPLRLLSFLFSLSLPLPLSLKSSLSRTHFRAAAPPPSLSLLATPTPSPPP